MTRHIEVLWGRERLSLPVFQFDSEALNAFHREIRCQFRGHFVRTRHYVVEHSFGTTRGPWTLNIAYEWERWVRILDLVKTADGDVWVVDASGRGEVGASVDGEAAELEHAGG